MHIKLHITEECNMRCRYCYVHHAPRYMSEETGRAAVRLALASELEYPGISFFGGEPLLCKELIYHLVEYAETLNSPRKLMFKLATNGLLLDEVFLSFAAKNQIYIALSMDGIEQVHNMHRLTIGGAGTFNEVSQAARKLLKVFPSSPVMMTINPDTAHLLCESVIYLYEFGFRYFVTAINYSADWDNAALKELKQSYEKLSKFYYQQTMREEDFYISALDSKIYSHINRTNNCVDRCRIASHHISVDCDGTIYPCIQFVQHPDTKIGTVFTGIDRELKKAYLLTADSGEETACKSCAIRNRCNHFCACVNMRATGEANLVSPVLCAHERLLLPIADRLAEKLYRSKSALFIQKHYNEYYPIIRNIVS